MSQVPIVAVVMGSKSDLPKLEPALQVLRDFDVAFTVRVLSAHRTPAAASAFASGAADAGLKVIICAAGYAAHLAGVVAAHTVLPVIGIPIDGGPFKGMDALLATVQMPGGIPVATVAAGSPGPKNAALLALRMLALQDEGIRLQLQNFVRAQRDSVLAVDAEVQQQYERVNE